MEVTPGRTFVRPQNRRRVAVGTSKFVCREGIYCQRIGGGDNAIQIFLSERALPSFY